MTTHANFCGDLSQNPDPSSDPDHFQTYNNFIETSRSPGGGCLRFSIASSLKKV